MKYDVIESFALQILFEVPVLLHYLQILNKGRM